MWPLKPEKIHTQRGYNDFISPNKKYPTLSNILKYFFGLPSLETEKDEKKENKQQNQNLNKNICIKTANKIRVAFLYTVHTFGGVNDQQCSILSIDFRFRKQNP